MRDAIFKNLARATHSHPWLFLLGALILAMVSGYLSEDLRMETRVLDLLPREDPAAVEFDAIVRQYTSASQIMAGIEGGSRQQKIDFADRLEKRIGEAFYKGENGENAPYVKRIQVRIDEDFIANHGLLLSKTRDLQNLEEIFQDLHVVPLLAAYNDYFEREYIEDSSSVTEREKEDRAIEGLKSLVTWLPGIGVSTKGERALEEHAELASNRLSVGDPYLFSENDDLLLVSITPALPVDKMDQTIEGVGSLKALVENIRSDFPELKVRMTGMPVLMAEETEVVFDDMGINSLVSLGLVLALFILAFRMWTAPLLAIITLILGIIWTSGFVAVTVGRLNLFTAMFAIILIGLGIDFSIHMNAAFSSARSRGENVLNSLLEMYHQSGAGVVTGAVTTATAFLVLVLTDLDALVELGVVLGSGILITLIAALTVLPAMYVIHARVGDRLHRGQKRSKPVFLSFPFLEMMGKKVYQRPWPVLGAFLIVTIVFGYYAFRAQFEPDMLEIEPPDMPSVVLHREIIKKFELHPDRSLVTSDSLEKTRTMAEKLKKNRLVGRVDAVTEFLPATADQKKRARIVARIGQKMQEILKENKVDGTASEQDHNREAALETPKSNPTPKPEALLKELDRLQMNIQEIGQLAFASMKQRLFRACERLSGGEREEFSVILGIKKRLSGMDNLSRNIELYENAYIPKLATKIERMANTSPITLKTLPDSIKERYLSDEGNNLVTIYSSVDLWQEGKTALFLAATKKASDRVTGTVVLMDKLISLIGEEGLLATILAFGTIFVILIIDFRKLSYALLGLIPLLVGFAWMVGIFVLAGKKLDVANVEALPLILGIGIDDAVHVLHGIKRRGVEAIPLVLRHTGRALLLTSLTTGIAFGSIALSSHRGMAGMGLLLVLGVASCFVASVTLLPALIRIFLKKEESKKRVTV